MRVGTTPGHSTDTPMEEPAARRSWWSVSLRATTPTLATLYGAMVGMANRPAIDAVLTTCPGSPEASMRGTNALTPWITPQRSTPITHCQSSSDCSQAAPRVTTPALLHTTCTAP